VPTIAIRAPDWPGEGEMRCKDVMKTNVQCAAPTDSVQSAAKAMRDRNIGFLPVRGSDGRVVGALTDRDIAIRVASEDRSASGCRVSDCMTREVVSCLPTDDLAKAEHLMATHKKSRVVIIDESGALCGVISLSDIAERDSTTRAAVTLRQVAAREANLRGEHASPP
jgi:CBS domain-containing protein